MRAFLEMGKEQEQNQSVVQRAWLAVKDRRQAGQLPALPAAFWVLARHLWMAAALGQGLQVGDYALSRVSDPTWSVGWFLVLRTQPVQL